MTTLEDFQLGMLHAMCVGAPPRAADLLVRVGATRANAAAAEKRWWYADRVNDFTSIAEYVEAWGAPAAERVERHDGGETRWAAWDLTFWPDYRVEWMQVSTYPHLFRQVIRHPDSPPPQWDSVAGLTPWSCTLTEFHDSPFAPVDHIDGFGSTNDVGFFRAVAPESGELRVYRIRFDWHLLQSVEPAPDSYVWKL
ncbi:hypothetical protein AB0H71_16245 [Nocardia sp. NPDC050697]|uniref:hypothetical protein n=1 Tax=Nocardia sp. NPDC050697 TaxID=3155158 RepID=UPI00340A5022